MASTKPSSTPRSDTRASTGSTSRHATASRHAAAPRRMAEPEQRRPVRRGVPVPLLLLLMVLALAGGVYLGHFVWKASATGPLTGKVTLSERQLDTTVATYVQGGRLHELSAREVLEHEGLLASSLRSDGSYDVPTADAVLATVRSRVLASEAERLGIAVTDEDVLAYAQATLDTRDLATVATVYGQSEEAVRAQLAEAALMARMRDTVVSEAYPEAPAMPAAPEAGEEVATSPGYADYIFALVGSEWDRETGTWASSEGSYAQALEGYDISAAGASYEAALAAYWVAYQAYTEAHAEVATVWTDYVNGLLSQTALSLSSIVV